MADAPTYAGQLLWFEDLDFPLTSRDTTDLEELVGIRALAVDDPDEWVLGYRILGAPHLEEATILYLARRLHVPGVRFDMKTMAITPPPTEELHELVKRYIREFTQIVEARQEEPDIGRLPSGWHGVRSVVVDCREQLANLRKRDLALARAHIAERLHFDVPALVSAGLSGDAQVDLAFPSAGDLLDARIGLGIADSFSRVRVRATVGDNTVTARFTSVGIATIRGLQLDPSTDLLHLTFEVKS